MNIKNDDPGILRLSIPVERFVQMAVDPGREACAKLAESVSDWANHGDRSDLFTAKRIATAIRARGGTLASK